MDVDCSLADIIKSEKKKTPKAGGGGRGRGGGRGAGRAAAGGRGAGRAAVRGAAAGRGKGARKKHGNAFVTQVVRGRGGRGGRGRGGRGRGQGKAGRGGALQFQKKPLPAGKWQHDMYGGKGTVIPGKKSKFAVSPQKKPDLRTLLNGQSFTVKKGALTTGTKIKVSNLNISVSEQDMKELFESNWTIKAVSMDEGSGIAYVVFPRKKDAEEAVKKYNNVLLDARPMQIKIVSNAEGNKAKPKRKEREVHFTVSI